ncbi:Bys1 family protein [Aspergillus mulundensis]|uniref:Bys1 family protein n=1 Tax=Aspergillus mulundensis TaxID=1810919 RepID=A0A3D8S4L2_9EURO|nr:hypothetical protein DSM5745_04776 [Aspergillus mulundensis]RDW81219.1 hypothetical protein DSM5745_04776 [Aspergillus mulundensis]
MHFNLAAILSLAPLALAGIPRPRMVNTVVETNNMPMMRPSPNETIGHAIVFNNCEMPIYLWSVGQDISPQYQLIPGDSYSEVYRRDSQSGGVAIKITTVKNGLYLSAPQTVFAYNLVENLVWYDLSDVFGDPFQGEIVTVEPSEPEIWWNEGVPPSGSQVRLLEASNDLVLSVCY